jgi:ankyrin repeat protein
MRRVKNYLWTVDECEEAMKDATIDDEALVRMFHQCRYPSELVKCAIKRNDERALRLLIAEKFTLSEMLHFAYGFGGISSILMLADAGLGAWDLRAASGTPAWHHIAHNSDESFMETLIYSGFDVNDTDQDGAAENENEKVLAMLIAAGSDVSVRDKWGNTPIYHAAANRNPAVIAMLIPLCDINAANERGDTPCCLAVFKQNHAALEQLITASADVRAVRNDGDTAFLLALESQNEKSVELLVGTNVDVNTVVQNNHMYCMHVFMCTAMHLAAQWCNERVLAKLIAAGGNVNATDSCRRTPCHYVCTTPGYQRDGVARCLAMLIAAGANVNAADKNGATPLRCAVAAGFSDCVSLLLNAGASMDERLLLVVHNVDTAALLLAAKADLNAVDKYGRTVCHRACNSASLLSFLVGAGADVRVKSEKGATVLHLAAAELTEGFSDVLPRLIDAGADVNLGDNEGNCAGHVAARAGRVDNLKLLLEHGAEIERRNQEGKTMLLLAARAKEHAGVMMRLLIEAGADTSVIDDSVAFGAGASTFPLLRSLGVNLNCVNDDGNTPCHFADSAALVALFALGVTMTAKNLAGEMPMYLIWPEECMKYKIALKGLEALVTFTAAGLWVSLRMGLRRRCRTYGRWRWPCETWHR